MNLTSSLANSRLQHMPPVFVAPSSMADIAPNPDIEWLPFTVRQVASATDLQKAVEVRHRAYARHLPNLAEALKVPEHDDMDENVVLLIAESKVDGSALGTVRIQTNQTQALNLEQFITLPERLNGKTIAEVRRLAVAPGTPGRLVRMLLLKAVYQICAHNNIDWILVGARPPLDRMYEQLTLADVLAGQTFLPKQNNIPHRVLGLETRTFHDRLEATNNPLLGFFFETEHPDIQRSCLEPTTWTHHSTKMTSTSPQRHVTLGA